MTTKHNSKANVTKRQTPILNLQHCSLTWRSTDKIRLTVRFNSQRIQRQFKKFALDQAIDLCRRQNTAIERGEGLLHEISGEKLHRQIGIEEAFTAWLESLERKGRNAQYIKSAVYHAQRFSDWLTLKCPRVKSWNELERKHVELYLKHLDDGRRAKDTIRNAIQPIRATAAFFARELNIPDVCKTADLTIKAKSKPQGDTLNSRELLRFLGWMKTNNPALYDVAMLTGLAGLRVLEATALRYCDINLEQGTITITETDTHKPKNAGSYRTIPVCSLVLDFLKAKADTHAGDPEDTICKSTTGLQLNLEGTAYTNTTKRMMKKARILRLVPETFKFKELRATFATIAACEARIADVDIERYVGHAGSSILRRHYIRIERALNDLVIKPIDTVFGNILGTSQKTNIKAACIYKLASA